MTYVKPKLNNVKKKYSFLWKSMKKKFNLHRINSPLYRFKCIILQRVSAFEMNDSNLKELNVPRFRK